MATPTPADPTPTPTPSPSSAQPTAAVAAVQGSARLRTADRYAVPRVPQPIDLRLQANEGPEPPRELTEWLARQPMKFVNQYPNPAPLEKELARHIGVDPARVVATAGADDALDRICQAFLDESRRAVMARPTFEMIPRYVHKATGGEPACRVEVPWIDPAAGFPIDAFLRAINGRTGAVFVVTPNNPTGLEARPEHLEAIAERLAAVGGGGVLVADLAYDEFADASLMPVCLRLMERFGNVAVTRTMSKAWGLAGLRVGYAVATEEIASALRTIGHPYGVSHASLALAERWLREGREAMERGVERVCAERAELAGLLVRLGADALPSGANFVLASFGRGPHGLARAAWVRDALASLGIAVRLFERPAEIAGHVRISCPCSEASFARLSEALRRALRPNALAETPGEKGDWVLVRTREEAEKARFERRVSLGIGGPDLLGAGAARIVADAAEARALLASLAPQPEETPA